MLRTFWRLSATTHDNGTGQTALALTLPLVRKLPLGFASQNCHSNRDARLQRSFR